MSQYDLLRLGDVEFEHLVQALLSAQLGLATIIFGAGKDGGREATYSGSAKVGPDDAQTLSGQWIIQAKFHDYVLLGAAKARAAVLSDLENELNKIVNLYQHSCDIYILATNVPLSGTAGTGSLDVIDKQLRPKYSSIKHIIVLHYDTICRLIDRHSGIRKSYLHLITPGDILWEIAARETERQNERIERDRIERKRIIEGLHDRLGDTQHTLSFLTRDFNIARLRALTDAPRLEEQAVFVFQRDYQNTIFTLTARLSQQGIDVEPLATAMNLGVHDANGIEAVSQLLSRLDQKLQNYDF